MRCALLLAIVACSSGKPTALRPSEPAAPTAASAPPARVPRVASKCPKLDVEEVLALPANSHNAQLVVDDAGNAHVVWLTLTWPRNQLRAAFHHSREVDGRWVHEDGGLPNEIISNSFDVAVAPNGKSLIVALLDSAEHKPRHYAVYAGPPWKEIGGANGQFMTLTRDGTGVYAAAYGEGRLAVHRATEQRLEQPELFSVDVPARANNVRVHTTNEGLTVDLENNLHSTNREPRLRITSLGSAPKTREVKLGGAELGPLLDGNERATNVLTAGKYVRIADNDERLDRCEFRRECEKEPPASFTTRLEAWDSKLAVRSKDMVVVGMAWTATGPLVLKRAPADSSMPDRYVRREDSGSGVLIVARADGASPVVIDETSLRLETPIRVEEVVVDARDRVHALIYDGPPLENPRYVRLGCAP